MSSVQHSPSLAHSIQAQKLVLENPTQSFGKNESDFITTMLVGNNIALVVYGVAMTQILSPNLQKFIHSDFILLLSQTMSFHFFPN